MDAVRVYAGSDHAGFALCKRIVEHLRSHGREVVDLGPDSDDACDYPEFASAVGNAIRGNPGSLGILVCATGQGMAIAAGKVRGIRAVVPTTVEAARLSRFDNNANVLCLAGRLLSDSEAFPIVDTWLATGFAGGRHARRIAKVAAIETASAVSFITESERLGLTALGIPARLFEQDASLVFDQLLPAQPMLGWLSLPNDMGQRLPEIVGFAEEIRQMPFKQFVLLANQSDGSAAVALSRALGSNETPPFHVVDDLESAKSDWLEKPANFESTLVMVVLKSGGKEEIKARENLLWSRFNNHFRGDPRRAGGHFVAITTSSSPMAEIAKNHLYRKVFLDPDGIPEGFAALGFEGLVPAALLGADPGRLLARARNMVVACQEVRLEENPAASLGVILGALAKHGRFKLALIASRSLSSLVPWIAQILKCTSHGGPGIEVQTDTPLGTSHLPDKVFVHLQADKDAPAITADQMEALHTAGQPFIQIVTNDRYDLGYEIFRWQMASIIAALVLRVNPCRRECSNIFLHNASAKLSDKSTSVDGD
jgi:RpiB/LacA/LacB family sugar-phosphate isomerase